MLRLMLMNSFAVAVRVLVVVAVVALLWALSLLIGGSQEDTTVRAPQVAPAPEHAPAPVEQPPPAPAPEPVEH
jgi:hypothetical protein